MKTVWETQSKRDNCYCFVLYCNITSLRKEPKQWHKVLGLRIIMVRKKMIDPSVLQIGRCDKVWNCKTSPYFSLFLHVFWSWKKPKTHGKLGESGHLWVNDEVWGADFRTCTNTFISASGYREYPGRSLNMEQLGDTCIVYR